jgi:hypothetical protein
MQRYPQCMKLLCQICSFSFACALFSASISTSCTVVCCFITSLLFVYVFASLPLSVSSSSIIILNLSTMAPIEHALLVFLLVLRSIILACSSFPAHSSSFLGWPYLSSSILNHVLTWSHFLYFIQLLYPLILFHTGPNVHSPVI